jgi:hypothetical protein
MAPQTLSAIKAQIMLTEISLSKLRQARGRSQTLVTGFVEPATGNRSFIWQIN